MALLLASQSGRESREQMRGYARRAEEHVHELADTATQVRSRRWTRAVSLSKTSRRS